jgi:hypothetical protein
VSLGPTQPPVQRVPVFPGDRKRPERDTDPSLLSSAEVHKQSRAVTQLSLKAFVACKNGETYQTAGHVFTKPTEVEGTTHLFFLKKLFFIVVQISAAGCQCKHKSKCRPLTAELLIQFGAGFLHIPNKSTETSAKQLSIQFHFCRSFGFLVTNVCNHGAYYETPCTIPNVTWRCELLYSVGKNTDTH